MRKYPVQMQNRDFTSVLSNYGVDLFVESFSWNVRGGPDKATIIGNGSRNNIAASFDRLRCPVTIRTDRGEPIWWGYVKSVEMRYGSITISVSLDEMANMITILYSVDGESGKEQRVTPIAIDEMSVLTYGIKEMQKTLSDASDGMAESSRDILLYSKKYPTPAIQIGEAAGVPTITYQCVGWWYTFWWRYYANSNTTNADTTTQIVDVAAFAGAFITGIPTPTASGISSSVYRDGTELAGDVMEKLLDAGGANTLRYLATVTHERTLNIYEEPLITTSAPYLIREDGTVATDINISLSANEIPIGRWAKLRDVPPTLEFGVMNDPTTFMLDSCEFSVEEDRWRFTTRGQTDAWDLLGLG